VFELRELSLWWGFGWSGKQSQTWVRPLDELSRGPFAGLILASNARL